MKTTDKHLYKNVLACGVELGAAEVSEPRYEFAPSRGFRGTADYGSGTSIKIDQVAVSDEDAAIIGRFFFLARKLPIWAGSLTCEPDTLAAKVVAIGIKNPGSKWVAVQGRSWGESGDFPEGYEIIKTWSGSGSVHEVNWYVAVARPDGLFID